MAVFTVKVPEGELSKAIRQISAWDGKTSLRVEAVLKNGTNAVAREARQRVPVRSGKLKKSIKTAVFHREAGRPGVQQCALCPSGGIRQPGPYGKAQEEKGPPVLSGAALSLRNGPGSRPSPGSPSSSRPMTMWNPS
jgi:hypothetical protein